MKTSVEVNGYVISIEEVEGVISVNAMKDDEIIEEFTIETEEGDSDDEDDVKGFDKFGEEEEDFEDDSEEDEDDSDDSDNDDEDEDDSDERLEDSALESFQAFINKKRK